jgi:hypothetical protein
VFGGLAVLSLVAVGLGTIPASATHPEATLDGSNFEIDDDADLVVDDAGNLDWASVNEIRATDLTSGQTDDSYKGGVKEDTECPDETTGSIPNNKSDLLTFSVYEEAGTGGHPGFLNLAWSRVTDPSGTTLMDFEFNQSEDACTVGPNVVRTEGDLLSSMRSTRAVHAPTSVVASGTTPQTHGGLRWISMRRWRLAPTPALILQFLGRVRPARSTPLRSPLPNRTESSLPARWPREPSVRHSSTFV